MYRYFNHLDPSIKIGGWSAKEDNIIMNAQLALNDTQITKETHEYFNQLAKVRTKKVQGGGAGSPHADRKNQTSARTH